MAGRRRDDRDDEGYHSDYDSRRRHRSQPPKGRVPSPIEEEPSHRPKLVTRDDSYYDPRDVYYLSGDEGPEEHPWYAQQREDRALNRRGHRSPSPSPRRRNYSPDNTHRHRKSSGGHRPHSEERRRSHSEDRHRRQRDEDERETRRSRRSNSRGARDHRRSTTAAPPSRNGSRPVSPHDSRRGARRDSRDHRHPPSASRSGRVRSSTQPAKPRTRSRSSSLSPIDQIKEHKGALMSAAKAMLQTGAMAAVKMHGEEGDWIGMKGAKVLSTALSAAAVDTFIERKKPHMNGGMRHSAVKQVAQVALVNLVAKPAVKRTRLGK